MTSLATRLVARLRMRASPGDQVEEAPTSWLPAKVWLAYGCGAVFAGAMEHWWSSVGIVGAMRWPSAALLLPVVLVAMVALTVAFRAPASREERALTRRAPRLKMIHDSRFKELCGGQAWLRVRIAGSRQYWPWTWWATVG
jgi:hypothetical protein